MRRMLLAITSVTMVAGLSAPAAIAGNPSMTGPPMQSCQAVYNNGAVVTPGNGHAALSPGSPFDEPGTNPAVPMGGTGGLHYSAKSQYDVACYQTNLHAG